MTSSRLHWTEDAPLLDERLQDLRNQGTSKERWWHFSCRASAISSVRLLREGTEEMDVPGPERRLAAVAAADMVGYSRLMEVDETGTLARLKTHRIELIDPAIAKNRGRIIKITGDGMLVGLPNFAE